MTLREASLLGVLLWVSTAGAQELDPRTYTPTPIGTTILVSGLGYSKGPIVLDPSSGIQGAEAELWFTISGWGCVFPLAGRQARILATTPMAWGEVSGEVAGTRQKQPLKGLVDPRFQLSIGLLGMPARSRREVAAVPRHALVGASLLIVAPLGRYEPDQLVNLSYHRWAFKPEIAASVPVGALTVEGVAGGWLYTTNRAYYPGASWRKQDPVIALQGHVSYALANRTWVAIDGTWFEGGRTQVDGLEKPDRQDNVRFGGTLSLPVRRIHSIKLTYSAGTSTRRGTDYDTFTLTWQMVRLGV